LKNVKPTSTEGRGGANNLSLIGSSASVLFGLHAGGARRGSEPIVPRGRGLEVGIGRQRAVTVEPAEGLTRGTQVRLHLKSDLDEFTNSWR